MMNFIAMTISVTVGMALAYVGGMVLMFKLMTNKKFMTWFCKKYIDAVKMVYDELEGTELF